jgi:hypothetical protein
MHTYDHLPFVFRVVANGSKPALKSERAGRRTFEMDVCQDLTDGKQRQRFNTPVRFCMCDKPVIEPMEAMLRGSARKSRV